MEKIMQGKIIKGIAGFYYVHVVGCGIYGCKAKGVFRIKDKKPLVGDNVEIAVLDEKEKLGIITELFPRTSQLIRPTVANIDQALIIFAVSSPEPNLNLLDRFLVMMEMQQVASIICFNKKDLVSKEDQDRLKEIYQESKYPLIFTSVYKKEGIEEIKKLLYCKTTALAGPSGVGKSSLLNEIQPDANMQIGEISEKIKRGKHTTRHSEIFQLEGNTYLMDTPGFTSLSLEELEKEELKKYFVEFKEYEKDCKFKGCVHMNEPICGVKQAVLDGRIHSSRYENYVMLYEELKEKRKY